MPTIVQKMEIRRHGTQVTLTLDLSDEYAAMEVYDRLSNQAQDGFVLLEWRPAARTVDAE